MIEGAHEGHGLGDRFLGHIERCRVLLHLIDATGEHAGRDYKTVRAELQAYGSDLTKKTEIVALSKIDAVDATHLKKQQERLKRALSAAQIDSNQKPVIMLLLSAASGEGVTEALRSLGKIIETTRTADTTPVSPEPWRP